jgi:hypothetical protein
VAVVVAVVVDKQVVVLVVMALGHILAAQTLSHQRQIRYQHRVELLLLVAVAAERLGDVPVVVEMAEAEL